jgi:catechol 2,3-dioxygenase-like lactoylglutathione lyase family enzyme
MTNDGRPALDQINVVVRDMEAMVAFYERLGVELPGFSPEWDPHHRNGEVGSGVHLDLDSQAFASQWNEGWPADRAGVVIGFRLPDRDAVDRLYADLISAGHKGQQEPYDAFWGARYAVVEDPDGNSVGLMSPQDDALRTPGPPPPA